MSGYFLVSRRLNDPFHDLHPHSRGEPACAAFAWIDLIGMARWKPMNGCPRGSVPASERFLATRWNWHRSKVSRFLAELEAEGRISREPQMGRKQGHISICNYDTYQDPRTASEPQTEPRVGPRIGPKKNTEDRNKKTSSSSGRSRRSRLPEGWTPKESHRERAMRDALDCETEVEKFRDYHLAKGSVMLDWDRAFFTWLGNAVSFGRSKPVRDAIKPEDTIWGSQS